MTITSRVVIEKPCQREQGYFQVHSVDFGWRDVCFHERLIPLPKQDFIEPFPLRMSMRIRLFNVQVCESRKTDFQNTLAQFRDQVMVMYVIDDSDGSVVLFDQDNAVNINQELVIKNICQDSTCQDQLPEEQQPNQIQMRVQHWLTKKEPEI